MAGGDLEIKVGLDSSAAETGVARLEGAINKLDSAAGKVGKSGTGMKGLVPDGLTQKAIDLQRRIDAVAVSTGFVAKKATSDFKKMGTEAAVAGTLISDGLSRGLRNKGSQALQSALGNAVRGGFQTVGAISNNAGIASAANFGSAFARAGLPGLIVGAIGLAFAASAAAAYLAGQRATEEFGKAFAAGLNVGQFTKLTEGLKVVGGFDTSSAEAMTAALAGVKAKIKEGEDEGKRLAAVFKAMGVSTKDLANLKAGDLQQLITKMSGMDIKGFKQFASDLGLADDEAAKLYQTLNSLPQGPRSPVVDQANIDKNTTAANNYKDALNEMGQSFKVVSDAATKFGQDLGTALGVSNGWGAAAAVVVDMNRQLAETIGTISTGLTAMIGWVTKAGTELAKLIPPELMPAFTAIGDWLKQNWFSTLLVAVTALISPVAGLAAGIAILAANADKIGAAFASADKAISDAVGSWGTAISSKMDEIKSSIETKVKDWALAIGAGIGAAVKEAENWVASVKDAILAKLDGLRAAIGEKVKSLLSLGSLIGGGGGAAAAGGQRFIPYAVGSNGRSMGAGGGGLARAGSNFITGGGTGFDAQLSRIAAGADKAAAALGRLKTATDTSKTSTDAYQAALDALNLKFVTINGQMVLTAQSLVALNAVGAISTQSQALLKQQVAALGLAFQQNLITSDAYAAGLEKIGAKGDEAKGKLSGLDKIGADFKQGLSSWGDQAASSIADAVVNGENLGEVFKNLLKQLASMILQTLVLKPLMSAITGGIGSIFGGGAGGLFGKSAGGLSARGIPSQFGAARAPMPSVNGLSNLVGRAAANSNIAGPVTNKYTTNTSINVAKDGSVSMTEADDVNLGRKINAAVQQVITKEQRSGGLLARTR